MTSKGRQIIGLRLDEDVVEALKARAEALGRGRGGGVAHYLRVLAYRDLGLQDPQPVNARVGINLRRKIRKGERGEMSIIDEYFGGEPGAIFKFEEFLSPLIDRDLTDKEYTPYHKQLFDKAKGLGSNAEWYIVSESNIHTFHFPVGDVVMERKENGKWRMTARPDGSFEMVSFGGGLPRPGESSDDHVRRAFASKYVEIVSDPETWLKNYRQSRAGARRLRRDLELLCPGALDHSERLFEVDDPDEAIGIYSVYHLSLCLAVENLVKAAAISTKAIHPAAHPRGTMSQALKTHDVLSVCRDRLQMLLSDDEVRLLQFLRRHIEWASKYGVPLDCVEAVSSQRHESVKMTFHDDGSETLEKTSTSNEITDPGPATERFMDRMIAQFFPVVVTSR